MKLTDTLETYLGGENGVVRRMIDRGYALKAAKSEGYEHGRHAADYYVEQSIRTHVLNGLFVITRLLTYLDREDIFRLDDADVRRLLALFTTHDLHKDEDLSKGKRGEFDISLEDMAAEVEALGIPNFTDTTPARHRWAMVHLQSPKVGDLSDAPAGTSRLSSLLRLADTLASMQTARECGGAQNRLNEILSQATFRHPERARRFYWHELDDYRGLSTLMIHHATAAVLEKFGLFPLLYFPNGILYVGPDSVDFGDAGVLRKAVAEATFAILQGTKSAQAQAIANDAWTMAQSVKFDLYACLFCNAAALTSGLTAFVRRSTAAFARNRTRPKFLSEVITKRVAKRRYRSVDEFLDRYNIPPQAEDEADFLDKWFAASRFVMGAESIARALVGEAKATGWLLEHYVTPSTIGALITENLKGLRSGGVADHCFVIAYHYLVNAKFGEQKRSIGATDFDTVLNQLETITTSALSEHDALSKRVDFVNAQYALASDLDAYLESNLRFSWTERLGIATPLQLYSTERTRSHGHRLCVFCNREIPSKMKERDITLAEMITTAFSNRLLPKETDVSIQVWCPMCWFEFVLRRLSGMHYPKGADAADRLYLYLLPDYSFTPDFWRHAYDALEPFNQITSLKLRQYGKDDPSLPAVWLTTSGKVDATTVGRVAELFQREAERMATPIAKGKAQGVAPREMLGERLHLPKVENPNYLVLTYEKSARDAKLAPTRSELWAKATYAGCLLHLLLGVRVYITDKPYLPITRPDEMKPVIQLDSPHPLLRGVLGGKTSLTLEDLPDALNVLSAAWEANNALSGGKGNLDKQIATRLERMNVEPLAGAGFYKEREREGNPVYDTFRLACTSLLKWRGGEKMNLARRIAEQSLDMFLPRRPRWDKLKGKAHRYETVFRTALEIVKKHPKLQPDELVDRVSGTILKRLVRIDGDIGWLDRYGDELREAAIRFAETVVNDLFVGWCRSSLARLTHEENSLASGIYIVIDQQLPQRWEDRKARKAAKGEPIEEEEETNNDNSTDSGTGGLS